MMITCGWILSTVLMTASFQCMDYFDSNPGYTPLESAFFLAFHRVGWALGLGWIIFACTNGIGGKAQCEGRNLKRERWGNVTNLVFIFFFFSRFCRQDTVMDPLPAFSETFLLCLPNSYQCPEIPDRLDENEQLRFRRGYSKFILFKKN